MKRRAWANIYPSLNGAMGSVHETRELADAQAGRDRIACVEIEFEDDEGENESVGLCDRV